MRSMHEMGEMKWAQEIRVDEFSVQKLRESHETIQRLTSQKQELQEKEAATNACHLTHGICLDHRKTFLPIHRSTFESSQTPYRGILRANVCGVLKPPESDRQWNVRLHGAFSIHRDVLGLRPNDQSCHHEAWLHLDFVGRHDIQPQRGKTLSKDSPERTVVAIPLRQEKRAYQWDYKRPFAFLVTSWPFAHACEATNIKGFACVFTKWLDFVTHSF